MKIKPKILMVEDHPENRDKWTRLLKKEGYDVTATGSPQEACDILKRELFHLALIDVRLVNNEDRNDTKGLELCRQIEADIPRIIFTAYPNWEVVQTLTKKFAESLVDKGVQPEVLLAEIRAVLASSYDVIPKRRFAILTSGGDAPGMNAAIWSALRTGLAANVEMFGINDGYQGLLNDNVKKLRWSHVTDTLMTGGTMLGTARSEDFKDPEKRKIAAKNLVKRHIDGLIVIGGDGSMQGARELAKTVRDEEHANLYTIGLPGTIDNDLPGDMSIGASSAVTAAMHEINNMVAPARALKRIFVCEIMGRHSGFLTLEVGLCVGADAVLLPEELVVITGNPKTNWHVDMQATRSKVENEVRKVAKELELTFAAGKRHAFVLFSEGIRLLTTNEKSKKVWVNLEEITELLEAQIREWETEKAEVRSQVIGYPMRGAPPSRFDIHLGTKLGEAAVEALVKRKTNKMLGWSETKGIIERNFDAVVSESKRAPADKFKDEWQKTVLLQRKLMKALPKLR